MSNPRASYLMSQELLREISGWRKNLPGLVRNVLREMPQAVTTLNAKEVRYGITVGYDPEGYDGEGIEDPDEYPTSPANTFWVKLGRPTFPQTAGNQTLTLEEYDPPEYRLAYSLSGEYVEEGTEVVLVLLHGQYFIVPEGGGGGASLFRFELTEDFTTFGITVAATVKTMTGATVGTGIYIADPERIFFGLSSGAKGYCIEQAGTYYMIQAACDPEVGYL